MSSLKVGYSFILLQSICALVQFLSIVMSRVHIIDDEARNEIPRLSGNEAGT
jgi:hypothetical protein